MLPPIPEGLALRQSVDSTTSPGQTYMVDLANLTCTCVDHIERRSGFSQNDLRRVCKHLRSALQQSPVLSILDAETRAILADDGQARLIAVLASGAEVIFRYVPGDPWVNVETRTRRKGERAGKFSGEYREFGFHLDEERWSYGSGPPAAGEIRKLIGQYFLA